MSTQIAATEVRFPTKLTSEHLDAALLYVMVNKIVASDAQLWERVTDAKTLLEKNNVIRDVRAELLKMKTNDRTLDATTVAIDLTENSPAHQQIKAILNGAPLNAFNTATRNGRTVCDISMTALLTAFSGQPPAAIPAAANAGPRGKAIDELRSALAEQLSSTESQQSQVLLQDALQKSRELVSMSGGLIKTRHDAKMGILQKY
jgi:hypothetical protein